ncbi:hypothetical protein PVK06_020725 [Gossypium arboreum]|uniref:Uncharacterized protein n=1 Tax=Gossypium arboreum TaxID=29729 RepID=A0ABR0PNU2_GOSAR|nr:hypothetical protein PVK06_020725 [Gossypium arboreum]
MATETLDDKKPEEEEVIDKENEEGSKEVLEKKIEVEEKENEKSDQDSTEKKEPVTLSSDSPTRERKVIKRYSAPSVARVVVLSLKIFPMVGAFSVLKELVVVLPDCLADHIRTLIPGIEKALNV